MKSIRAGRLAGRLALGALALGLFALPGKAQSTYQGKFALPVAARWGSVVLLAGDYSFTMQTSGAPYLLDVRGQRKQAFIMTAAADTRSYSGQSQLNLIKSGEDYSIGSLELPELGLTFVYGGSPAKRETREHMTRAPEAARNASITQDEDMSPWRYGP